VPNSRGRLCWVSTSYTTLPFPMFELLRHLSYISILHIFPLHEDYGQDGADDDDDIEKFACYQFEAKLPVLRRHCCCAHAKSHLFSVVAWKTSMNAPAEFLLASDFFVAHPARRFARPDSSEIGGHFQRRILKYEVSFGKTHLCPSKTLPVPNDTHPPRIAQTKHRHRGRLSKRLPWSNKPPPPTGPHPYSPIEGHAQRKRRQWPWPTVAKHSHLHNMCR